MNSRSPRLNIDRSLFTPLARHRLNAGQSGRRFRASPLLHLILLIAVVFTLCGTAYATCGDGVLDPSEQCDDGNVTSGDGCDASCVTESCGDGTINNEVWTARESNRSWYSITSSSDGTKLAASADFGQIYTSADSGVTWTPRESVRRWYSITSSSDGTKLAAVAFGDQIYTSTDSGVTWTPRESVRNWNAITSSSDGTKLAATTYFGQIYTSTDSGVTWTPRESSRGWAGITSSSDGTKLAATHYLGFIYTSTDSGVTWTPRESVRTWYLIASSSDGTKLTAVTTSEHIYTSTDSGVTWTPRESSRDWNTITSSSDGTKLAAAVYGGQIYTSTDSGVTWNARENNRNWSAMTSSSDGTKLAAAEYNGKIYTRTQYEDCDDGNTADGDNCTPICTNPVCGDGYVSTGEQCDDGNVTNGDGCSVTCATEVAPTPTSTPTNTPTITPTALPTNSVPNDSISGRIVDPDGSPLTEPVAVYLTRLQEQQAQSTRIDSIAPRGTSPSGSEIRSTLTDKNGYFSFNNLSPGTSYTIQARLDGYSLSRSEITVLVGSFVPLTATAAEIPSRNACVRNNRVRDIVNTDQQSLRLKDYIVVALDRFEAAVTRGVPDGQLKRRIQSALTARRDEVEAVHARLMMESFKLPTITYRCDSSSNACPADSYRTVVRHYRGYLLALRRSGLFSNRLASPIIHARPSSRKDIARKIKQLHVRTLRFSQKLPRHNVVCK